MPSSRNWNLMLMIMLLILFFMIKSNKAKAPGLKITNGVAFEKVAPISFLHSDLVVNRALPIIDYERVATIIRNRLDELSKHTCSQISQAKDDYEKPYLIRTHDVDFTKAARTCEIYGGYLPSLHDQDALIEFQLLLKEHDQEIPPKIWAGIIQDFPAKTYYYHRGGTFVRDTTSTPPDYTYLDHYCTANVRPIKKVDDSRNYDTAYEWYYDRDLTLNIQHPQCQTPKKEYYPAICIVPPREKTVRTAETLHEYCTTIARKHTRDLISVYNEFRPMLKQIDTLSIVTSNIGFGHKHRSQHQSVRRAITDTSSKIKIKQTPLCLTPINQTDLPFCQANAHRQRQKRLVSVALSAFGIARTIASEVNGQLQIQDLHQRLDDTNIRLDKVEGTLLDYSKELQLINDMTNKLQSRTDALERAINGLMQVQVIDDSFSKIIKRLYLHVRLVKNVVKGLIEKRTTTHILPYEDLSVLDSVLRREGIESYTSKDYNQMSAEITHANRTSLLLRIIIPLWEIEQYTVYKAYPIPDLSYKLIPRIEEQIVIMTSDKRQYATISDAQLSNCLSRGCKRPTLIKQSQLSTCGVAQILGKDTEYCQWDTYLPNSYFTRTEKGFIYAIPNPYNAIIKCPNNQQHDRQISNTGFLEIPAGCKASLLSLQGMHSVDITGPSGILEVAEVSVSEILDFIAKNVESPIEIRTTEFHSFKRMITTTLEDYQLVVTAYRNKHEIAIIVGILTTVLFCIIGLSCFYLKLYALEKTLPKDYHFKHVKEWLFYCCGRRAQYNVTSCDENVNMEDLRKYEVDEEEEMDTRTSSSNSTSQPQYDASTQN